MGIIGSRRARRLGAALAGLVVAAGPLVTASPASAAITTDAAVIGNDLAHWDIDTGDSYLTVTDASLDPEGVDRGDAFDDASIISINGTFVNPSAFQLDGFGTEGSDSIDGLDVSVSYFAFPDWAILRNVVTLHNPSGSTISPTVRFDNNWGSDSGTVTIGSGSGDQTFDTGDQWLVTSDDTTNPSDPVNTTVFFGPGSPAETPTAVSDSVSVGCCASNGASADFDVDVPAGETVFLVFYHVLSASNSEGLDWGDSFEGTLNSELTCGIPDLGAVLNWDWTGSGATCPRPTSTTISGEPSTRLAGTDRIDTAIASSQYEYPSGGAGAVVLARHDQYADALAGTPLAVAKNGPLLLTPTGGLDSRTEAEIQRVLGAGGTVYLLGGEAALGSGVASRLSSLGFNVVRLAGADRYATAVAVVDQGLGNPGLLLLASGTNFPDALAGGAAAGYMGGAILLTAGNAAAGATSAYLSARSGVPTYALGGPAAAAYPSATPIVGADRFETATMVADQFFPGPNVVGVANGLDFPDALAGGAMIGHVGGPLVLVTPATAPDATAKYVQDQASNINRVFVFGGENAVSHDVEKAVAGLA